MKLFRVLTALCALILTAAAVRRIALRPKAEERSIVLLIRDADEPVQAAAPVPTIRLKTQAGVEEVLLEDYLVCVVLSEMPADFEPEAFKAQAVAARTFARKQAESAKHTDADVCGDSGCCQAYTAPEMLRQRFGDAFTEAEQKARLAVQQTAGEVLTYGGALIDATYFSCSGGMTEAAAAVWGTDVPYLQSVASPGEEAAPRFSSQAIFSPEEFREKLKTHSAGFSFSEEPEEWVEGIRYYPSGGVQSASIAGKELSGTQLRSLFGLNSARFALSFDGENFCFDVQGFGHRVGMSQYGANRMAQLGFDYRAILLYYYQGVTIGQTEA